MTAATLPTHRPPLTETDMPYNFHGINLSYLGEEAESVFALGHVDKVRFVAAVNVLLRADDGYTLDFHYDNVNEVVADVEHTWVFNMPACTSDDPSECPHTFGECAPQEFPWFLRIANVIPETPGAFRITLLDLT